MVCRHLTTVCISALLCAGAAYAQAPAPDGPVAGDASIGPDVIIGSLNGASSYGSEGGVSAFAFGFDVCNLGDEAVEYVASTNEHPVLTNNLYRLKDGRFEHIGMSWEVHEFTAITGSLCSAGCSVPGTGALLGVGCSSPESASIAGTQSILGPRSQVDANTGVFTYPRDLANPSCLGCTKLDRRIQVQNADLDPALNDGAIYFAEVQIVAPDDAAAGNQNNNASYRPMILGAMKCRMTVSPFTFTDILCDSADDCPEQHNCKWFPTTCSSILTADDYCAILTGTTEREQPGIRAWHAQDPSVVATDIQVPGEGFLILAANGTDLGKGWWRYEYALQNVNSDRSVRALAIPLRRGAPVANVGFHDVDYHSGEPFDGIDWPAITTDESISWSTSAHDINPNANALRWGTLYNFRFDSQACPGQTTVSLELFKPGVPTSISAETIGPELRNLGDFTGDCVVDLEDLQAFTTCLTGPGVELLENCTEGDFNEDARIDLEDVAAWQAGFAP